MMYVSDALKVLDEFSNFLIESFHSGSKTVDFNKGEEVRNEINTNVEKETNSKIKDLIPSGTIIFVCDTNFLLLLCIYYLNFQRIYNNFLLLLMVLSIHQEAIDMYHSWCVDVGQVYSPCIP